MSDMWPQGDGPDGPEEGTRVERPRTRGDCEDGPRPCPWIGCRYHLFEDVAHRLIGCKRSELQDRLRRVSDDRIVELLLGMEYTCALDYAAKGPNTLEDIGRMFGLTRERVRQIQSIGLRRFKHRCGTMRGRIKELLEEIGSWGGMKEWK